MPTALTNTDLSILKSYADTGKRELYWNYLKGLGDPYAARALEVVRNDTAFGQLANNHAAAYVPGSIQTTWTEVKWNKFGADLTLADYNARKTLFDDRIGDRGLTLDGETIRGYHKNLFEANGIPAKAWTLETSIGYLFDSGDPSKIAQGNAIWTDAIGDSTSYLKAIIGSRLTMLSDLRLGDLVGDTAQNGYRLLFQYDSRDATRNPNSIRGWQYDEANQRWSRTGASATGPTLDAPSGVELQQLNLDREYRLQRLNDPLRFQPNPADRFAPTNPRSLASLGADPLNPDAHNLAIALGDAASGDYWSTQAGTGTGTAGTVPPNVVANIEAALAGQDLGNIGAVTAPQTYKVGGITYVDFGNGNQIAIDLTGRVASTKVEVSASGLPQTTHTGFDQSKEIYGVNADGTRTVLSLNGDGIITGSALASAATASVTEYSSPGVVASTIAYARDGSGGTNRTIDTVVNGQPIEITQHASAASLANGEQPGDYATTAVKINGVAAVNNSIIAASIDEAYPSAKDIILNRGTGEFTHIVAAGDSGNADGTTPSLVTLTGRLDWWNDPRIGNIASDTVSLLSALRGGKPLPIATAGLNFASHHLADPAVAEIAAALSVVGNVVDLVNALEKGDLGRILIDGGGIARSAITIYSNSLQQEMISRFGSVFRAGELGANGNAAAADLYNSSQAADALLQTIGQAIAVLNIINSVINGDIKGAVIGTVALYFGPVYGAILIGIDFLYGEFFPNDHQFEANGRFIVGDNGQIAVQMDSQNGDAGDRFFKVMGDMLAQTQKQATEIGKLNGQPMGVIAERLPTIEFKQDVMFMRFKDPLSGQDYVRTFDMKGKYLAPGFVEQVLDKDQNIMLSPWGDNPDNHQTNNNAYPKDINPGNQIAQSKIFFDHIALQYSDAVTASGAIAPLWEVETVNLQRLSGYQYAGQTTEAIAYQSGTSYGRVQDYNLYYGTAPSYYGNPGTYYSHPGDARPGSKNLSGQLITEASQQTASVIALDLNGDGVITVTKKATGNGVLFDVDNDGFEEETDWIGPREGILVLDRASSGQTADGQINRGRICSMTPGWMGPNAG